MIDENDQPHLTSIPQSLTAQDVRDRDWNEMKVTARGNHFEFFVNGKPAASLTDNSSLDDWALALLVCRFTTEGCAWSSRISG